MCQRQFDLCLNWCCTIKNWLHIENKVKNRHLSHVFPFVWFNMARSAAAAVINRPDASFQIYFIGILWEWLWATIYHLLMTFRTCLGIVLMGLTGLSHSIWKPEGLYFWEELQKFHYISFSPNLKCYHIEAYWLPSDPPMTFTRWVRAL